ncbi:Rho GTPase activation protein, partial [Aureobasidium melanogenum]
MTKPQPISMIEKKPVSQRRVSDVISPKSTAIVKAGKMLLWDGPFPSGSQLASFTDDNGTTAAPYYRWRRYRIHNASATNARPMVLCLETKVAYEAWFVLLQALTVPELYGPERPFSDASKMPENDVRQQAQPTEGMFRIERSLSVKITEAKFNNRLARSDSYDFHKPRSNSVNRNQGRERVYAEVLLGKDLRARTTTKSSTGSAFWAEEFNIEDIPAALSKITIAVKLESPAEKEWTAVSEGFNEISADAGYLSGLNGLEISSHDPVFGRLDVSIDELEHKGTLEKWWPLLDNNDHSVGTLLLRLSLRETVVLIEKEYTELSSLLQQFSNGVTTQIAQILGPDLRQLSDILLDIFQASDSANEWISSLIEEEIDGIYRDGPPSRMRFSGRIHSNDSFESAEQRELLVRDLSRSATMEANLLFRGNSLATKALDAHMRRLGKDYLEEVLGEKLRTIIERNPDCEVDPNRVASNEQLEKNWANLLFLTKTVWRSISDSASRCPMDLRVIFRLVRSVAEDRYGSFIRTVKYTSVSGFLFLRFFCPAILNPRLFGLIQGHPPDRTKRTFTLIAKSLNVLANVARFGTKEPWMEPMNKFLASSTNEFKAFIDEICAVSSTPVVTASLEPQFAAPNQIRNRLPEVSKEGLPSLPFLLDNAKLLAQLVGLWMDHAPEDIREVTDDEAVLAFHALCVKLSQKSKECLKAAEQAERPDEKSESTWQQMLTDQQGAMTANPFGGQPMEPQVDHEITALPQTARPLTETELVAAETSPVLAEPDIIMQSKPERLQDQRKHKTSDREAGKDAEGDEDIDGDYLETFSTIKTSQQRTQEFCGTEDDDSKTNSGLSGSPSSSGVDTSLGVDSQGESQLSTSTLPEPTLGDLLAALAQKIATWEAPEDLVRLYPQSLIFGSLLSPSSEEAGLNDLIAEAVLNTNFAREGSSKAIDVEDFCVYRSPHHHHAQGQFDYLSLVASELALGEAGSVSYSQPCWLLDGLLLSSGEPYELRAAEIIAVNTNNPDDCESRLPKSECLAWIMTTESKRKNVWYRLRSPSRAYKPFWTASKWLSNFADCFIRYLDVHLGTRGVRLCDFQSRFWVWLCNHDAKRSQEWATQCGNKTDYRQYILSHWLYLYRQAHVFGEPGDNPIVTVLEAYQRDMVRRWNFPIRSKGDFCKEFVTIADGGRTSRAAWILEEAGEANQQVCIPNGRDLAGRVVILRAMNPFGPEYSYAWVRKATTKTLHVVWLVLPSDTICGSPDDDAALYPMGNELFFSDRCSCEEVSTDDIVRIANASVFEDRAPPDSELFVRSLYRHADEAITIPTKSELFCECLLHKPRKIVRQPRRNSIHRDNKPKLRGLSLFSGCGLFDAAFTCNGNSEIVYATEICEIAARSYKANDATNRTHVEIGSVEDGFEDFALGRKPMPDIDFIIGGFPCPFYSTLNHFKHTRRSQKDGSLVANMLSWIEIFMPPYVLMENVPNMDRIRPNACRQAICHLVALGYQVRKSVHNDANLGGVSIRQRLFIVAAAPGVMLPDKLVDSHGTGLRKIRTASEAIGDLSPIDNDTDINILDPSHVPISRLGLDFARNVSYRSLVRQIPTEPKCMSLSRTYYGGGLLAHQRKFFEQCLNPVKQARNSKCLQRIDPDKPFRTVCTVIAPMDARFCGHIIHPSQHRTLSLKEGGRRAMGMPDYYLLAGSVEEQYKQCGNAVPWTMGAAWGRNFARAWFASLDRRAQEESGGEGEMPGDEGHHEDDISFESRANEDEDDHNSSDKFYIVDSGDDLDIDDGDDDKHDTRLDFEKSNDGDDEDEDDQTSNDETDLADIWDDEDENDEDDDNNYQFDFQDTGNEEGDHYSTDEMYSTDSADDGDGDGDEAEDDDEDENNNTVIEFEDSSDDSDSDDGGGSDDLGHDYCGGNLYGFNHTHLEHFYHGDTTLTPEDGSEDSDSDSSLEILEVRPVKRHRMG